MISYQTEVIDDMQVRILINWKYGNELRKVKSLLPNNKLGGYIESVYRKVLIDTYSKFVNHRDYILSHITPNLKSVSNTTALAECKKTLSSLKDYTLKGICVAILYQEKNLKVLLPGIHSKYYHHDHFTINELLTDCNKILKSLN